MHQYVSYFLSFYFCLFCLSSLLHVYGIPWQGTICLDTGAYLANLQGCHVCGVKDSLNTANRSIFDSQTSPQEVIEYDREFPNSSSPCVPFELRLPTTTGVFLSPPLLIEVAAPVNFLLTSLLPLSYMICVWVQRECSCLITCVILWLSRFQWWLVCILCYCICTVSSDLHT